MFGGNTTTTQPTSIFGSTPSTFGATPAATTTTTMFGATATPAQPGTTVKFEPVSGQGEKENKRFVFLQDASFVFLSFQIDTMRTKNGTFQTISTKLQCISAMKEYLSKSMEELRMEDYQSNRKFAANSSSLFGGTSTFNPSPFGTTRKNEKEIFSFFSLISIFRLV